MLRPHQRLRERGYYLQLFRRFDRKRAEAMRRVELFAAQGRLRDTLVWDYRATTLEGKAHWALTLSRQTDKLQKTYGRGR